ncbi:MAG: flagellar protein FlaG [Nitrosomonadales bacterium]|nr:flagellar protein FlaG [Nitrosomonadales bacterium]
MLIQNVSGNTPQPNWGNVDGSSPASSVATASSASFATGAPQVAEPSKDVKASEAQLKDAVDKINNSMKGINSNLQFSIDSDTQRVVVKVVESQTGKLIKQFPSEEALSLARAIDGFQKGLLVKQSA